MREAAALVRRHLLAARRSRGAWVLLIAGFLALAMLALLLGGRRASLSSFTLGGLALVGVLAFGAAAWAGSLLPADRAEGRETWLATLAPSGALRRGAVATAGALLALATAVVGAAAIGLLAPHVVDDATVRVTRTLPAAPAVRLANPADDGPPLRILLPPPSGGGARRTLEVVFRPRYHRPESAGEPLVVAWRAGVRSGETRLPYDGPLRLDLPDRVTEAWVANRSRATDLIVEAVRVQGRRGSYLSSLLLAGLVLGIAAATVSPATTFVSRWTSAPTAVATGFVLALAGGIRTGLDALALPGGPLLQTLGLEIVEAAARLAPNLGALSPLAEPAAGRALVPADLSAAGPLLVYAGVAFLLVLVPRPRRPGREVTT